MERANKREQATWGILKNCRNRIYLEMRFLESALFRLMPEAKEGIFLGSNGEKLYYNEEYLLKRYLQSPEALRCDYLHIIIHCLYQHPFQAFEHEEGYWDLAADITVADVMREMEPDWVMDQIPKVCFKIADDIRREVPLMSAPHIAKFLQYVLAGGGELCGYSYEELRNMFRRDSHECWYRRHSRNHMPDERGTDEGKRSQEEPGEGKDSQEEPGKGKDSQEEPADGDERSSQEESGDDGEKDILPDRRNELSESLTGKRNRRQMLSEEWKDAAESVVMSSQSFTRGQGKVPDSMILNIQRLVRERYDYAEFLRKFAVMNEKIKVNLDEFDYTYYLYGLRSLKKIPLIEPLEYKEEYQIKEFVIVIDTSGSCSEGLAQRFLNKTYNILKQTEHFAEQVVIHVIQCDAAVQEDVRITSLERLEEYIEGLVLKGGGGTDFRPAFEYVDRLYREDAFERLCGLIYFTDGYGIFPSEPPNYKTAFVFVEREDCVKVPSWAMRLYLEEGDV